MSKETINCINPSCRTALVHPGTPFIKCYSCRTRFFSFCHQFPATPNTYTQCSKCPNQLYYFFCSKCKQVMCFKNYKMGQLSKCKCGFEGCYVVCNNCNHQMCYPPGKRYEGLGWTCHKCQKLFSFMTCDECFRAVYGKKFREGEEYQCGNRKCRVGLVVKKCLGCNGGFLDSRGGMFCGGCEKGMSHNGKLDVLLWKKLIQNSENTKPKTSPRKNHPELKQKQQQPKPKDKTKEKQNHQPSPPHSFNPFQKYPDLTQLQQFNLKPKPSPITVKVPQPTQTLQVPKPKPIEKSFGTQIQQLCKICLDKQAEFVNTKCFHLSTCEACSISMKNICPICRAEGEFHRIYK